jgi:hypothetical protein
MYQRNASLDQRLISMMVKTGMFARYIAMAAPERMAGVSAHFARLEAEVVFANMYNHSAKVV